MTKVYPNSARVSERQKASTDGNITGSEVILTVWKKSLLLNCNGFTVFDSKGNLVFRVDNYIAGNKNQILLMDDAGTPLLTIRHKFNLIKEKSDATCINHESEAKLRRQLAGV